MRNVAQKIIKSKEDEPMKAYMYLTIAAMMFLGACSSAYQTRSGYDDIYYSKKTTPAVVKTTEIPTAKTDNYSTNYGVTTEEADTNYYQKQGAYDEQVVEEPSYTTETYYDDEGETYITNNYYGDYYAMDDYYDYAYAARIRRFHNHHMGFSYYHDYYTNYYWYNYNPWNWGISIYSGYPWWYSIWNYGSYNYWGWSHYYGWGYPSYYSHYWGYPSHYWSYNHGYWNGYHNGYWDGYYNGTSDYYYNSYDRNSYYGPRNAISSTNGRNPNKPSLGSGMTFGQKYQRAVAQEKASGRIDVPTNIGTSQSNIDQVKGKDFEADRSSGRLEQIGNVNQSRVESEKIQTGAEIPVSNDNVERPGKFTNVSRDVQKNPAKERTLQGESRTTVPVQKPKTETQPARSDQYAKPKQYQTPVNVREQKPVETPSNYERPGYPKQQTQKKYEAPVRQQQYYTPPQRNNQQVSPNNKRQQEYSKPKSYSTPDYAKPKSSKQYTSPKSKVVPNYSAPQQQQNSRQYTPPSKNYNNGSYSTPRQQSSPAPRQKPSYKAPSRSSGSYSAPSRSNSKSSYSAPSRSNSSYSAPSRSSSSYSAPSRSSSSYSAPSSSGSRSSSSGSRNSGSRGR